ncbi:MAG: hypothetical protein OQK50_06790 [Deltaproteobacteria bacterium]|nr:hypothetical protein [Deltaproteobacteria bacterium]
MGIMHCVDRENFNCMFLFLPRFRSQVNEPFSAIGPNSLFFKPDKRQNHPTPLALPKKICVKVAQVF